MSLEYILQCIFSVIDSMFQVVFFSQVFTLFSSVFPSIYFMYLRLNFKYIHGIFSIVLSTSSTYTPSLFIVLVDLFITFHLTLALQGFSIQY